MTRYTDYEQDLEQDWEDVKWEKKNTETNNNKVEELPFHRKLINARMRSQITTHKLAQLLSIKIKEMEDYEKGNKIPDNRIITKITS